MNKLLVLLSVLALVLVGCKKTDGEDPGAAPGTKKEEKANTAGKAMYCAKCSKINGKGDCCKEAKALCTKCGMVKGDAGCCKKDAAKCKCGMIKGAPGCCKMPSMEKKETKKETAEKANTGGKAMYCAKCSKINGKGECCKEAKALCSKCGVVKGDAGCCKKDAAKCKCGMIKGAPGCCKMPGMEKK